VLKIEPQEPGKGFEFVDAIKGGVVPREFIPAVKKGVEDSLPNGVLAGFPVVDVKVTLIFGSYHEVDSNENAFKMAASLGFKDGCRKASPVILEPMMAVEVETPEDYAGNVMGDLSSRRGMVQGMRASFRSFGYGLLLSVLLLYLILVAQFRSFLDPALILLAVPPGLAGVILILAATGTTLNVQSLLGVIMMTGIVVSNSILIVDFTHRLRDEGKPVREAVAHACRIRLRPVLMTSMATLFGLLPMALKMGTGSEAYAPLAIAIIGGLTVSLVATVFIVPAAYLLVYGRKEQVA